MQQNELIKNQETENEEMEIAVSPEIQKEIETKIAKLKSNDSKLRVVFPIIVMGEDYDEKELYVAYFKQPDLITFSKYLSLMQKDITTATRTLANDCFLDGDKELVNDDSLFMFGLMQQLPAIIKTRHGRLLNLSKPGK